MTEAGRVHRGVRYVPSGAMRSNCWHEAYMDFLPAYVMINLYSDGTADSEFVISEIGEARKPDSTSPEFAAWGDK